MRAARHEMRQCAVRGCERRARLQPDLVRRCAVRGAAAKVWARRESSIGRPSCSASAGPGAKVRVRNAVTDAAEVDSRVARGRQAGAAGIRAASRDARGAEPSRTRPSTLPGSVWVPPRARGARGSTRVTRRNTRNGDPGAGARASLKGWWSCSWPRRRRCSLAARPTRALTSSYRRRPT